MITIELIGTVEETKQDDYLQQLDNLLNDLPNDNYLLLAHNEDLYTILQPYARLNKLPLLENCDHGSKQFTRTTYGNYVIAVNPGSYDIAALRKRGKIAAFENKTAVINPRPQAETQKPRIIATGKKSNGKRRRRKL